MYNYNYNNRNSFNYHRTSAVNPFKELNVYIQAGMIGIGIWIGISLLSAIFAGLIFAFHVFLFILPIIGFYFGCTAIAKATPKNSIRIITIILMLICGGFYYHYVSGFLGYGSSYNRPMNPNDDLNPQMTLTQMWNDISDQANGNDKNDGDYTPPVKKLTKYFYNGANNNAYTQLRNWANDQAHSNESVGISLGKMTQQKSGNTITVKYPVNYSFTQHNDDTVPVKKQTFDWTAALKKQGGQWRIVSNNSNNQPVASSTSQNNS